MDNDPKVGFLLGGEVSPRHLFNSLFVHSHLSNNRDTKSLNLVLLNNDRNADDVNANDATVDGKNCNFFSLVNLESLSKEPTVSGANVTIWNGIETAVQPPNISEVDKLRKQCQTLTEENQRLQNVVATNQLPQAQEVDNVFLQMQVNTLQWQLKQTEANRQMYQSLMEQIAQFLERAYKSLDILYEKNNKSKDKSSRVPRSRSVHEVDIERSSKRSSISSTMSRFSRAKSVAQLPPNSVSSLHDITCSVLRRNDRVNNKSALPERVVNQVPKELPGTSKQRSFECSVYKRPKQMEVNPDEVSPEKLAQEAFTMMRAVLSLLSTREPDLTHVSMSEVNASSSCFSSINHDFGIGTNYANSTPLRDSFFNGCYSDNERRNSSIGCYQKANQAGTNEAADLPAFLSCARVSLDATTLNPGSGKTAEVEESSVKEEKTSRPVSLNGTCSRVVVSTSNCLDDKKVRMRSKLCTNSASSAEDESGFSSMSSFQEVGIPVTPLTSVKGCHTEVGLPEVPLDKVRHRRWTSTPAEMQALFKRHNAAANFAAGQKSAKTLRELWV